VLFTPLNLAWKRKPGFQAQAYENQRHTHLNSMSSCEFADRLIFPMALRNGFYGKQSKYYGIND